MADPMRKLERLLRSYVVESLRQGATADAIQLGLTRLLARANIQEHLSNELRARALRIADWMRTRTSSEEDRRRAAEILYRSHRQFAQMGGRIHSRIAADVRSMIANDYAARSIEAQVARHVRGARAVAATITNTAVAGFDRLSTFREADLVGVQRFKFVGPPAQRPFCRDRLGKIFTLVEIQGMDNGQGLSVQIYCGGYNCRHTWEAVIDSARRAQPAPMQVLAYATDPSTRDGVAKQYFNSHATILDWDDPSARAEREMTDHALFGRSLLYQEHVRLCGAPDGAKIIMRCDPGDPEINYEVDHECYNAVSHRRLSRNSYGQVEVYNGYLRVNTATKLKMNGVIPPPAFGVRVFATQVIQAKALGVSLITTHAEGDYYRRDSWIGYYVWPCCGYDGPIPSDIDYALQASALPEHLKNAAIVSDLISDAEGRAWWKRFGHTVALTFDIDDGSVSEVQLLMYLEEKGIRL